MDRGEYVLDLICHFSIQAMIIKFNIFLLFVKYRFDETYFDVTWIQYISLAGKEKMKGVMLESIICLTLGVFTITDFDSISPTHELGTKILL